MDSFDNESLYLVVVAFHRCLQEIPQSTFLHHSPSMWFSAFVLVTPSFESTSPAATFVIVYFIAAKDCLIVPSVFMMSNALVGPTVLSTGVTAAKDTSIGMGPSAFVLAILSLGPAFPAARYLILGDPSMGSYFNIQACLVLCFTGIINSPIRTYLHT